MNDAYEGYVAPPSKTDVSSPRRLSLPSHQPATQRESTYYDTISLSLTDETPAPSLMPFGDDVMPSLPIADYDPPQPITIERSYPRVPDAGPLKHPPEWQHTSSCRSLGSAAAQRGSDPLQVIDFNQLPEVECDPYEAPYDNNTPSGSRFDW